MEDLRPTCFFSLEVPLTVTFNVISDDLDWPSMCSEADFHDLKNDSSIRAEAKTGAFERQDPDLCECRDQDLSCNKLDYIHFGSNSLNCSPLQKEHKIPCNHNSMHHFANFLDTIPVINLSRSNDTPTENGSIFENGILTHAEDPSPGNSTLSDACVGSFPVVYHLQGNEIETCLKGGGSDEMCREPVSASPSLTEGNCSKSTVIVHGKKTFEVQLEGSREMSADEEEEEEEEETEFPSEISLPGAKMFCSLKEEFYKLTINSMFSDASATSQENSDLSEQSQMDLNCFSEEENEGKSDDGDWNTLPLPNGSASEKLCGTKTSGYNCCDEIYELSTKKASNRPKTSILKHSKTSSSFDYHTVNFPRSLKESWTQYCHLVSNTMSSKNVLFLEHPVPKQTWLLAANSDTSNSMETLKAVINHLHLPVQQEGKGDGQRESGINNNQHLNNRDSHMTCVISESSDLKPDVTSSCDDMNELIDRVKKDLFQMKEGDEVIASQLLTLYGEIRQYKYMCNCHLYREMMETAIDNENKKDELSHHHVDTIPERLCTTFKQWGLTRINLQRRRFSIF